MVPKSNESTGVCRVIMTAVARTSPANRPRHATPAGDRIAEPRTSAQITARKRSGRGDFGPSGFCQDVATCEYDYQSQAAKAAARNHGSIDCLYRIPPYPTR